jgi:hypothetical protein
MTPTIINRIISAVAGLALVGGGIYLLSIGESVEGAGLIAGGVGTIALPAVNAKPAPK